MDRGTRSTRQGQRRVSIWGSIKHGLKRAGQVLGGVVGQPVGNGGTTVKTRPHRDAGKLAGALHA